MNCLKSIETKHGIPILINGEFLSQKDYNNKAHVQNAEGLLRSDC